MAASRLPQYKIGVWGPRTSGKTVYLWVYTYLIDTVQSLKDREWHIEADEETRSNLNELRRHIVSKIHVLPNMTDARQDYSFTIDGYGKFALGRLRAAVQFSDWPGEVLKDDSPESEFYQELRSCDAILCFIDPLTDPSKASARSENERPEDSELWAYYQGKLDNLFHNLIETGKSGRYVPQVMAFLITKVDHKKELWDLRYQREDLLRSIIRDAGLTMIKNHCKPYRIFPCSSIGALLNQTGTWVSSNLEPVSSPDSGEPQYRIRDLADFERKPFGVTEPMTWVLEELKKRRLWR